MDGDVAAEQRSHDSACGELRADRHHVDDDLEVCEDSFDGIAPDFISEVLECAPQPCVPPCRVLVRHAYDELTNVLCRRWSARTTVFAAVVLGRNEVAIPAQKRIGCEHGANLGQRFSTQSFGLDGESAALFVREPESFAAKLCSEHTVFFSDVFDHGLLIAVDPASQAVQQELEMVGHHEYEGITLGPNDCTAHGRATVAALRLSC